MWQYMKMIVPFDDDGTNFTILLNSYGQQGWELCGITVMAVYTVALLKKPAA